MRMFLVVMCDMFLLLYLTALSQMEARPVSELTVQDYFALKESAEELKRAAETKAQELFSTHDESKKLSLQVQELEQRLKAAEAEKKLAEEQKRAADEEKKRLAAAAKTMEGNLAESSSREAELKSAQEAAKLETEKIAKEAAEREAKLQHEQVLLKANANKLEENIAKLAQAKEEEQRKAEELKAQADAALAEAEKSKQAAAESAQAAKTAQDQKDEALQVAAKAETLKSQAIQNAAQSATEASEARVQAAKAAMQADKAEKEKIKTKERIQAISQKAQNAYSQNVASKRIALDVSIVTQNLLIGSSKNALRIYGIPVAVGSEKLVFVPLDQVGIPDDSEPDDFVSLKISVGDKVSSKVYVSGGKQKLLAVVVSSTAASVNPVPRSETITSYMPTLIALRNGSEMGFSDSVRDLNSEHYVFQRDRLTRLKNGMLEYQQKGFRGTGEFGERLLKGDQILDLDGNFVGIAVRENAVLPVPNLDRWKSVSLNGNKETVFKQLLE